MNSQTSLQNSGRLLSMKHVEEETSLHRSTINRMIKSGKFPHHTHEPSERRKAWSESVIESWKADRAISSN